MIERKGYETSPIEKSNKLWFGKDFVVAEKTEIKGLGLVPVLPQDGSLPDGEITDCFIATRSRFAQWGMEVLQDEVEVLDEVEREFQNKHFRKSAEILVKAHARDLIIPEGTPIFSLYTKGLPVVGEELAMMMDKEIKIDGDINKSWKYIYKNRYTKRTEDITGIAVHIRNDRRWHIPNADEALDLDDLAKAGSNYREVLDKKYKPVPRSSAIDIWFGELPNLELSHNVAVEIAKPIVPSFNISADIEEMERQRMYPNGRHIGARLLHPGSGLNNPEGWPIRVEIDTRGSVQKPGAVIFRVMRAG